MRHMTRRTVFLDRFVLEDERAFLVLVAGVAEIVEPKRCQQHLILGAVHIVAAGTAHLAFPQRMARRQLELCRHLAMAGLACIEWLGRGMHCVAIKAADRFEGMGRSVPILQSLVVMTAQTAVVTLPARPEGPNQGGVELLSMAGTGSMATLAADHVATHFKGFDPSMNLGLPEGLVLVTFQA